MRPVIITTDTESSIFEQFQNHTLRPILKQQNDLLLAVFLAYSQKRKDIFHTLKLSKKLIYIEDAIRKDLRFKGFLLGMAVGHFTKEEYATYVQHEAELSRRLTNLMIQRLQSQAEELKL
jgi:hypothetical protein